MIVAGLIALTVILTGVAIRVGVDRGITTRVITASEPEPLIYAELGAHGVVPTVPVFVAISMFTSLPAWLAPMTMVVVAFGIVLTIRRVTAGREPRKARSGPTHRDPDGGYPPKVCGQPPPAVPSGR